MFSLLRMAVTLLICFLAVGFYLGWVSFHRSPDPQSNKVNINVSVDENKVKSDLQKAEQNLSRRIQDINNQPQGNGTPPPSGQQRQPMPRLNLGPISVQPSGPSGGQPAGPVLSYGPFSVQTPGLPVAPPSPVPTGQSASPDFQYSVPLGVPPPGDGR